MCWYVDFFHESASGHIMKIDTQKSKLPWPDCMTSTAVISFWKALSNSSASSSIVLNKASGWAKMRSNFPTFTSSTECCKPLAVLTGQSWERLQAGTSCWVRLLRWSDWIKLRGHITNTHPLSRSLLFLRAWGNKEYTRLFPYPIGSETITSQILSKQWSKMWPKASFFFL